MKILSIRPLPAGGTGVARFDVELPSGIRLFNLRLADTPRGLRVHAPSAFGCSVAAFSHELTAELAAAASLAFGEMNRNAQRAA